MSAAGLSTVAATPASGSEAAVAGRRRQQQQPEFSSAADSPATIARGDESGTSDRLPASAKRDLHYFDVLHPILLSHVRRGNSDGVLALLSLPSIAESEVFWRTCTYCQGLVAAVLIHVMEHTGQLTVPASPPAFSATAADVASPPGVLVASDDPPDDSRVCSLESTPKERRQASLRSPSPHSSRAPPVPSGAVTVTDDGLSRTPHSSIITPLTVDDLHSLLHLCSREGAAAVSLHEEQQSALSPPERTGVDSGKGPCCLARCHPPALASLLRVGKALRQRHYGSGVSTGAETSSRQLRPTEARRQVATDLDLELYVKSVMYRLEAMMDAQTQTEERNVDAPSVATHKRSRSCDAPTVLPTSTSSEGKRIDISTPSGPDPLRVAGEEVQVAAPADAVDLAALAAVLQEHCHDMVYVSPFNSRRLGASTSVEESTDSTATTATTIMGISSSNSNGSLANLVHAPGITTTANTAAGAAAARSSAADLGDAAPEAVSRGVEKADEGVAKCSDAQDVSEGLDAVELLRRIPAISATRWALPSGARSADNCDAGEADGGAQRPISATAGAVTAQRGGAGQRHPACAAASASADSSSTPLPCSSACTMVAARQTPVDEEQARVSAGIRAFDAFTAALEESAPTTVGVSAAPPQSLLAPAAPSLSSCTGSLSRRRTAARPVAPGALHARPSAPPPPPSRSSTSEVRRRHKFSPQEDAAILHGVARFGQMSGSFQYILHAYRPVWRAGRTALHLYDHWRGALRRRAVAAVSSAVTSHADRSGLNKALDDEEGALRISPIHPATPHYEQDLSSDIEGFSDDS
ncbi:hypothetical protein GH5_07143 [Leishmania sp. Ghana 2012 LV757]|uniref:hypothetical protein n=1 Tax=Leishmania sp. Ghana 2012 LV757 TaxID=2803181 RepID=UPI001B49EA0E|nr:hypothetical protein GH5_07143 [Leishmania sp. Ghana 2012 LV757]